MGENFCSEEQTEPFSQSEFHARLRESIRIAYEFDSDNDNVHLDELVIEDEHHEQGVRILIRPLTRSRSVSPGSDNCEWLALRAEVATSQLQANPKSHNDGNTGITANNNLRAKVLAVTQTHKDINFSLRIPGEVGEDETRPPLWCELYYDPASDNQILLNRSDVPINLARMTLPDNGGNSDQEVVPGTTRELQPGSFRVSVYGTPIIDFRILAKRPAKLWIPIEASDPSTIGSSEVLNSSTKRSFSEPGSDDSGVEKRLRTGDSPDDKDGLIMFYPRNTAEPLVFPLPTAGKTLKEIAIPSGHTLLQVQKDETVVIPGGCELDQYQLTKRDQIATTAASAVFTAQHSDVPDGVITVKVLKTRGPNSDVARPQDNQGRNVIRQADIWLREYQSQENLQHESIVKLYGGDARYLSLYMEHIDGKDLAARGVWRDAGTDVFVGDRSDAIRILRDIAGALNYVHQRKRVHNDIKPANILYSRERGAVLCDFGLSTRTADPATNGGTPYYIPPEMIGHKLRGTPSDVWALGVTMLYVLRKITFPDARGRQGHPKQLYWMIADINKRPHSSKAKAPAAIDQMAQWLSEITTAKTKLSQRDKLHMLVSQMLTPNPNQRITMAKVLSELTALKAAPLNK